MVVDSGEALRLGQRSEVGAENRLARDVELLGDRGAGDDVVTGHHPHPDVRRLRVGDRGLRLLARRVDHADQARHLQALDQGEQIAVRVEAGRVQIAERAGHHPQTEPTHALDLLVGPLSERVVPGDACAVGQRGRRPAHHGGRGTLDVAPHDVIAGCVLGLIEGRHQLVARVERQRGETRQLLARPVDVQPGLVREYEQGALGGIADHLAVDELRVARDDVRQDRRLDGVGLAGRVADRSLEAVADARDRVAVGRIDDLDRRHLVHRQRSGLVRVDR